MEVETRKVQKLGYSSVGISLPKDWAQMNGMKPGSIVTLAVEDDGTLRVRTGPAEGPEPLEAVVDASGWEGPESLTRVITGNYIVGRSTIRVRSRDELSPGQLQEIHDAARGLTGLTIVSQGPKFVTIENFAEPTRFPIDGLLRRLHYLTVRMENLALGILTGTEQGTMDEVVRMEAEVDRLYWLVVRQLLLAAQNRTIAAKIGETEPRHLLGDRVVAIMLENIGDSWEELARGSSALLRPHRRIPREFAKILTRFKSGLENVMDLTMTAFFTENLAKANEALDAKEALEAEIKEFGEKAPGMKCDRSGTICRTCTILRAILKPLEHVTKYYGTIAQITINRALEPMGQPISMRTPTVSTDEPSAPAVRLAK